MARNDKEGRGRGLSAFFVLGGDELTVQELIDFTDRVKPNDFSEDDKVNWITQCEGIVQSQVMLMAPVEFITYTWPDSKDYELLVNPPFDKLYRTYMQAMIDYHNGEYGNYQNTMTMFNSDLSEFSRWFSTVYRPADIWRRLP